MADNISDPENNAFSAEILTLTVNALQRFHTDEYCNLFSEPDGHFQLVKLIKNDAPVYFLLDRKLGSGAYGEVFEGVELDIIKNKLIPENKVAVKIVDFTEGGTLGLRDIPLRRDEALQETRILNLIGQLEGASIGQRQKEVEFEFDSEKSISFARVQELILAMPLYAGKNIDDPAHQHKATYGSMTFSQLASNLSYNLKLLHDNNVIHSDLKPANVVWAAEKGIVNIIDFGQAKVIQPRENYIYDVNCSDRDYMAPECFQEDERGYKFSSRSDVYSLGKILLDKFNLPQQSGLTLNSKPYLSYDELLIQQFLHRMIATDEFQRPSVEECAIFFQRLNNKMLFDIEQPDNELRLKLSKQLISLEVYANEIRKDLEEYEINDAEKLHEPLKAIDLIVQALSESEIDIQLIKDNQASLFHSGPNVNSFLDVKSRYNTLMAEMLETIKNETIPRPENG